MEIGIGFWLVFDETEEGSGEEESEEEGTESEGGASSEASDPGFQIQGKGKGKAPVRASFEEQLQSQLQ